MAYGPRGHVEPDGEWIERVDGPLRVRKLSVEEMDNNVYVLSCVRTGSIKDCIALQKHAAFVFARIGL